MYFCKILVVHRIDDSPAHNGGNESEAVKLLKSVIEKLNFLTLKIDEMATRQERFDAVLARIDAVTTNIAADYQKLLDEVKAGTVSDESLQKAEDNIAKLETLASSVENPVPGETFPTVPVDGQ